MLVTSQHTRLILASASPRRRELLQQLGLNEGVKFEICIADIDETAHTDESAVDFVQRMAAEKASVATQLISSGREPGDSPVEFVVLAADTIVTIDGHILGKPNNQSDAIAMYAQLSGRTHQVYTAITVSRADHEWSALSCSDVRFGQISANQAIAYWQTGEGHDKAGGYAIQGRAAMFVEHLSGSYSGVVGLPLYETAKLLNLAGITVLSTDHE